MVHKVLKQIKVQEQFIESIKSHDVLCQFCHGELQTLAPEHFHNR